MAGRIGDSPIVGSGCYVSNDIGGAAATGDGDVLMRFMPAYAAWNYMRLGYSAQEACDMALEVIPKYYPTFQGGVVCLSASGEYAGSSYNMGFSFSVASDDTNGETVTIPVTSVNP